MSKAALLCNGPSRSAYTISTEYSYVLGCNVPWTEVDATVILDKPLIEKWYADRDLIRTYVFFGEQAWALAEKLDKDFFQYHQLDVIPVDPTYHSSGHVGAEILIRDGYKEIDVYGCDAWFGSSFNRGGSYTRQFIDVSSPNEELRMHQRMLGWKMRWQNLIKANPDIKLNFIKG